MLVVRVRYVRVCVPQPAVPVEMRVGLAWRVLRAVFASMVFVMHMRMCVRQRLMAMFMLVTFGEMQPDADRHEGSCDQ
jgi:hypothetical protein